MRRIKLGWRLIVAPKMLKRTGSSPMGRVDGKVAIISGGARGMGASHARLLAAEGANVVIGDVLDNLGEQLAGEIGDSARYVQIGRAHV